MTLELLPLVGLRAAFSPFSLGESVVLLFLVTAWVSLDFDYLACSSKSSRKSCDKSNVTSQQLGGLLSNTQIRISKGTSPGLLATIRTALGSQRGT